ncbi:hypothetical protein FB451DRAFT_1413845 [Mycena latifolia]|nr:hypothetical protein FB451DRAFT_1413845 [Mycena latifolia]
MSDRTTGILGSLTPLYPFLSAKINTAQPYPVANKTEPQIGQVCFVQSPIHPTRFLQDYLTDSPPRGLATVSGLWTLVNGAFALMFGATILYFLLGSRPLSALGFAHKILGGDQLKRNLREDFPAFEDEGGRPGTASAGFVS